MPYLNWEKWSGLTKLGSPNCENHVVCITGLASNLDHVSVVDGAAGSMIYDVPIDFAIDSLDERFQQYVLLSVNSKKFLEKTKDLVYPSEYLSQLTRVRDSVRDTNLNFLIRSGFLNVNKIGRDAIEIYRGKNTSSIFDINTSDSELPPVSPAVFPVRYACGEGGVLELFPKRSIGYGLRVSILV
ncbi:hypothetical protein HY310_02000 [Candidatus Microgenomates bacterium]|nr:hypothetical protein [Candidatus Microgenomates bacterium]